jgi:tetratricopeptide (TPR) repeat protein
MTSATHASRRIVSAIALTATLLCGAAALAWAQGTPGQPPAEPEGKSAPRSDRDQPPAPPRPVVPQARPDGARPLERPPQTADEKARQLSDLYAQLATAESEEAAKKLATAIERLWRISGSDTVSLLVGRAAKAINEQRMELAGKLLDSAIELAPDYAEIFNQRAYLHFKQNDYTAAVGDLRRALALDPNHYKALEGLAQIWRETGNKKGALGVMRQLLEVHPFSSGARKIHDDLEREVRGQGI